MFLILGASAATGERASSASTDGLEGAILSSEQGKCHCRKTRGAKMAMICVTEGLDAGVCAEDLRSINQRVLMRVLFRFSAALRSTISRLPRYLLFGNPIDE